MLQFAPSIENGPSSVPRYRRATEVLVVRTRKGLVLSVATVRHWPMCGRHAQSVRGSSRHPQSRRWQPLRSRVVGPRESSGSSKSGFRPAYGRRPGGLTQGWACHEALRVNSLSLINHCVCQRAPSTIRHGISRNFHNHLFGLPKLLGVGTETAASRNFSPHLARQDREVAFAVSATRFFDSMKGSVPMPMSTRPSAASA